MKAARQEATGSPAHPHVQRGLDADPPPPCPQVFALIVFSCIFGEGYSNTHESNQRYCVFNHNEDACRYGSAIGVLAFLACAFFFVVDVYFPQISNAVDRKYLVIGDLLFSALWTFLWFVGFCFLTNQWAATNPKDVLVGADSARAAITFSFFSIFSIFPSPQGAGPRPGPRGHRELGFSAKDEAGGAPTCWCWCGAGAPFLLTQVCPPLPQCPPQCPLCSRGLLGTVPRWCPPLPALRRQPSGCCGVCSLGRGHSPVPVPPGLPPASHRAGLVPTQGHWAALPAPAPTTPCPSPQQGGALPDNTQLYVNILP
ncbi:Synaptogyrin-2 [Myotis brandtii]|uniref:Synaptogyrin-2 n=1 Tax=Myotis brandtii TaxID=109478 RepID=S7Q6D6_MYOBR|nr:Synaptogyrin-2 [Myotis brandtii]